MTFDTRGTAWQMLRRVKWRLDRLLDPVGLKLERKHPGGPSFFSQLLDERLASSPRPIAFVQIGANDGVLSDPLSPIVKRFPTRFRGLVVEPLKDKFELLTQAYASVDTVIPVNVAIHNTEKEMVIHRVRPDVERTLPPWAKGLASFDADHYQRSQLNSGHMTTERVACLTFDELLTSYRMNDIELLVTDTEGYDFEILTNIDFTKHRPAYMRFEHGLSGGLMSWDKYRTLVRYLTVHGYSISHESDDATAFLPEALAFECDAPATAGAGQSAR
jgi:FkbM family methyltransferase